jgi:hypothetical protein
MKVYIANYNLNIEVRKREEYYLETRYGELSSRE